jgi:uncharacterized protein (TIGR00369 family)
VNASQRVRESFARQGFMSSIGAEVREVLPGKCVLVLPFNEGLSQQHGFYHGGVVGALADTAAGYAAFTMAPPEATILTVEYKVSLLAPATGPLLIATGVVVRAGRNIVVSEARVTTEGAAGRLCSLALGTYMLLPGRPDTPAAI